MTAQVADTLQYEGHEFSLAAIENDWPFTPEQHGLKPRGQSTACYRGYYSRYSVIDGSLFLTRLNLATAPAMPVSWLGVQPRRSEFYAFDQTWAYDELRLPIPYSGGVIAGREFLREFYVHMGFQRPHTYKTVIELEFEAGQLKRALDQSDAMERVRKKIREHRGAEEGKPSRQEVERFVAEAFSLSYDKKWRR